MNGVPLFTGPPQDTPRSSSLNVPDPISPPWEEPCHRIVVRHGLDHRCYCTHKLVQGFLVSTIIEVGSSNSWLMRLMRVLHTAYAFRAPDTAWGSLPLLNAINSLGVWPCWPPYSSGPPDGLALFISDEETSSSMPPAVVTSGRQQGFFFRSSVVMPSFTRPVCRGIYRNLLSSL